MTALCIFGGGQMGSALLGGVLRAGTIGPEECVVVEPRADGRDVVAKRFPGVVTSSEAVAADGAILAMKPTDVKAACSALAPNSYGRILSIAAGVTLSSLESWLWDGARVVRAMPNTPSLVGAGAAAIAPGHFCDDSDLSWAESVLSAVGVVVRLPESDLDAVTGLSGSGPAYVFLLAESLIAAGIAGGLDEAVSRQLTNQTLLGAARMLSETDRSASELRAQVTSPNGTTAAAIAELEASGVRDAFARAVTKAVDRSRELGAAFS